MIVHDKMEQGSPEWQRIRLGMVTASRAGRLITPSKMEYSSSARSLIAELLVENMLHAIDPKEYADRDVPVMGPGGMYMARGTDMEAEAVDWYEMHRMVDVSRVGFCESDDGRSGCSPDGLVGEDGGLEVKCRSAVKHLETVLGFATVLGDPGQAQFSLFVTGCEWWDVLAYNPALPKVIERHRPIPQYQKAIGECLERFAVDFDKAEESLAAITGDCVDRDNLIDLLKASVMAGKASEPDGTKSKKGEGRLSPAETKELYAVLTDAEAAGVYDAGDVARVLEDATNAQWEDVRNMMAHAQRATTLEIVK